MNFLMTAKSGKRGISSSTDFTDMGSLGYLVSSRPTGNGSVVVLSAKVSGTAVNSGAPVSSVSCVSF